MQHYAEQVRAQVWEEAGHLYPQGPNGETVLAWLWARTVKCPNPVCGAQAPLVSSTWLSKRKAALTWAEPVVIDGDIEFMVYQGETGPTVKKTVSRSGGGQCVACDRPIPFRIIRDAGEHHQLGVQPMAVVTERNGRRIYRSGSEVSAVDPRRPDGAPEARLEGKATVNLGLYGFETQADVYTNRQLTILCGFALRIADVYDRVLADRGDHVYATTISSILGLALGKLAQSNSTQVRWKIDSRNGSGKPEPGFGFHGMPMVWDFTEANPFGGSVGDWLGQVDSILRGIATLPTHSTPTSVRRADARGTANEITSPVVIVTDPPYFNQIEYADSSDYFYVWHREALRRVHSDLYRTIVTPKDEELIATPHRHDGDKDAAGGYFVHGFTETFRSLKTVASAENPMLVVYAHQQRESASLGAASTGWDAMLEAILAAGLVIEGTLPIRGTSSSRQIGQGRNALAAYTVMVCRPRETSGEPGTIADLRSALRRRLPPAVEALLDTGESMVDIRQAAIGPGMEAFCQFASVYDGSEPIRVHRALTIINDELGRLLDEHLGEVDAQTRWACQWYADHGFGEGDSDRGLLMAQTYSLGLNGLEDSGVIEKGRSKIRLLNRSDLKSDWTGAAAGPRDRTSVWEACQHLVKRLRDGATAGEQPAAELLASLGAKTAGVRQLAQYLTNLAIEKGWSEDAIDYDALVKSWPRIEELAAGVAAGATHHGPDSGRLFES